MARSGHISRSRYTTFEECRRDVNTMIGASVIEPSLPVGQRQILVTFDTDMYRYFESTNAAGQVVLLCQYIDLSDKVHLLGVPSTWAEPKTK